MSKKRQRRGEELECLTKKAKNQKGLLIFDIPEKHTVKELRKICGDGSFIPTSMGKHVRILYCISNNHKERIKILRHLVGNNILKFDPYQVNSRNEILLELQSIIDNFKKLILERREIPWPLSPETQQDSNQIEERIQDALIKTKERCLDIFTKGYAKIKQAFKCLEKERASEGSQDINGDDCIWLILYCIIWLLTFKISTVNLTRYRYFFQLFNLPEFFDEFRQSNKIVKILTVDIFWQLVFLKDQFLSETYVIISLINLIRSSTIRLEIYSPDFSALLSEILQTKLVTTHIKRKINYQEAVKKFVSNIYLIYLHSSLQGMILFIGYVVINQKSFDRSKFAIEPVHRGYTLLTALHEFGHFARQINLNTSLQWLNHKTPEYVQREGINKKKMHEPGSKLITNIFGYELRSINIPASEYLMDIKNWRRKKGDFQNQLKCLTNNNERDDKKNGRTQSLRLREIDSSSLSLVGCGSGSGGY